MAQPEISVFITTGRCGTQWLADNLAAVYADRAAVTHEPLGPAYHPRRYLRQDEDTALLSRPDVAAHFRRIRSTSALRHYVETGWPVFAAIPLFLRMFPGRVRIVHLVRHPVPTALSHMVHQCYGGSPREDEYTRLATLDPSCPGVVQAGYRSRWHRMTPYERCLFWWTEVHLYAQELQAREQHAPWLTVRYEDLFGDGPAELARLVDFLHLPQRERLFRRRSLHVDRWAHRTEIDFDWRQIERHPGTLAVAAGLGYDLDAVDPRRLDARYRSTSRVGCAAGQRVSATTTARPRG